VKAALPPDDGDAKALLAEFARAGVDNTTLAAQLQHDSTRSFTQSWNDLMDRIASNLAAPKHTIVTSTLSEEIRIT